jgi:hypothetical protein
VICWIHTLKKPPSFPIYENSTSIFEVTGVITLIRLINAGFLASRKGFSL